jgi:hypothetical protein
MLTINQLRNTSDLFFFIKKAVRGKKGNSDDLIERNWLVPPGRVG